MDATNSKVPSASVDRPHNAAHPHHHIINEGITALPGNDGVDQLEMEKEVHGHATTHNHSPTGSIEKNTIEVGESKPEYSSEETHRSLVEEDEEEKSKFSIFYAKHRIFFHIAIGAFFTAWWLVGIINHRNLGWLKPFLVGVPLKVHLPPSRLIL